MLLIEKQDPLRDARANALNIYPQNSASQNIIDTIIASINNK
jgi:hypothetical protein